MVAIWLTSSFVILSSNIGKPYEAQAHSYCRRINRSPPKGFLNPADNIAVMFKTFVFIIAALWFWASLPIKKALAKLKREFRPPNT